VAAVGAGFADFKRAPLTANPLSVWKPWGFGVDCPALIWINDFRSIKRSVSMERPKNPKGITA